jgi:phosphatidylethanolamine/phosphatidyl-N-methylethanolamine N-methyltransferase
MGGRYIPWSGSTPSGPASIETDPLSVATCYRSFTFSGGPGIRTPMSLRTPVFKTGALAVLPTLPARAGGQPGDASTPESRRRCRDKALRINTNRWNRLRYTAIAPIYDRVISFSAQRRRSIELLGLKPGERVLVVGAGTGADLPHLPRYVAVTATDITPAMVERTRERAGVLGVDVQAEVMDGQSLDLTDGSFDAVILHLIVAVIPDPRACLREAARVLRPGGRAVVFDKFVPGDAPPSIVRRMLNTFTNVVATDITRRLGPLVEGTGFRVVHREAAAFGGQFEIALLRKVDEEGAG